MLLTVRQARAIVQDMNSANNNTENTMTTITEITYSDDTEISGYGTFQSGTYLVEHPDVYDPSLIQPDDIINDCAIRIVNKNLALASQIVGQMSDDDRVNYDRDEWRDGVSNNCIDGEDLEIVLNYIGLLI